MKLKLQLVGMTDCWGRDCVPHYRAKTQDLPNLIVGAGTYT